MSQRISMTLTDEEYEVLRALAWAESGEYRVAVHLKGKVKEMAERAAQAEHVREALAIIRSNRKALDEAGVVVPFRRSS